MKKEEIWNKIKKELYKDKNISKEIYNYYINDMKINKISNNNCLIITKTEISISLFNTILKNKIKNILFKITGINFNIKIILNNNNNNNKIKNNKNINNYFINKNNKNINNFYKNYTFENFIKGNSNREAFEASLTISLELGKKWNPLFIFGNSGLGKTHLLYSIKNKINKIYNNKKKVKYLKAYEFGKIAIDILNKGHENIEIFKNSYDEYDCLLIDDIQLLAKRNKTNELFFYIFNSFIEKNKQIVITSDKYPDDLWGFESRIISRFSYGLSIGMDSPDFETSLKIVKQKLKQQKNLWLFSEESLEFIALNFNKDIRKLEGAIKRILFLAVIYKKPNEIINIKDVEEAFKNTQLQNNEKITSKKIKQIVADNYNITIKLMISKSRISNVMQARQLSMYFCRTMLDFTFSKIGIEFGGKDHTTVINSVKKIEQKIINNKNFKKLVFNIKKKIELE